MPDYEERLATHSRIREIVHPHRTAMVVLGLGLINLLVRILIAGGLSWLGDLSYDHGWWPLGALCRIVAFVLVVSCLFKVVSIYREFRMWWMFPLAMTEGPSDV